MAVWQYDLWIVPKSEVDNAFVCLPNFLELEEFESQKWWINSNLPKDYEKRLDSFLPKYFMWWRKEDLGWGSEDGNRIEIAFENLTIDYIFVRIDARNIDDSFLVNLVEFAQMCNGYLFLMKEKKFMLPDVDVLKEKLCSSEARLFVTNPTEYLEMKRKENIVN
jgi:hypothetical protein